METESDKDIAVDFVKTVKEKYPNLSRCSFDKGFHSPDNQKELSNIPDGRAAYLRPSKSESPLRIL